MIQTLTTDTITPPASEPVTVQDLLTQLSLTMPTDAGLATALTAQLTRHLVSARHDVENYLKRALVLQVREARGSRFPRLHEEYGHRRHGVLLPSPPLMAVLAVTYVDLAGATQTLPCDYTNGADPSLPSYAYQIDKGSETMPATIQPAVYRFWPPVRCVENALRVRFRCGYGGEVSVSTTATSGVLSGFVFAQDDIGAAISIPAAGAAGAALVSSIASVDADGVATLADAAVAAVSNAEAYLGKQVPAPIQQAILVQAQEYYTQSNGASWDWIESRLKPYRNDIS